MGLAKHVARLRKTCLQNFGEETLCSVHMVHKEWNESMMHAL